jgi:hypothetical protein
MHRCNAAILTAALALSVLLPFLSLLANLESNLPPCCRRNGSHRCAMRMMPGPIDEGTAFRTAASRCPFQKALTPACRLTLFPANSAMVYAAILSHPAVHLQTVVTGLIAKNRSHLKRGPPFLLAC